MGDAPIFWVVRRLVEWRVYAVYTETSKTFKARQVGFRLLVRMGKERRDVRLTTEAAAIALADELNMHETERANEMKRALDPIRTEYDRRIAETIAKRTGGADG